MDENRYEDLVRCLRDWRSIGDDAIYDVVGMAGLLQACLANLNELAVEAEWDQVVEALQPAERALLLRLAERIRTPGSATLARSDTP